MCVSLVIQHVKAHAPYYIVCGKSGSTTFSHLFPQTVRFSEESYLTRNVCCDFLYNFCLKHFSFYAKFSEMMNTRPQVKSLLFPSYFNEIWILLIDFRKILKCQISSKSVQWGPELLHAGGGTERRDEAKSRLSKFCERDWKWMEMLLRSAHYR